VTKKKDPAAAGKMGGQTAATGPQRELEQ